MDYLKGLRKIYSCEMRFCSLDLWKDFCYSYLEMLEVLFVMFMNVEDPDLVFLIDSGFKESDWRNSEKEKFDSLLDIRNC